MSYNPITDFIALLRQTAGGVRSERMPGLDYVVAALARAGLISISVGQTAPVVNQATTVWFQPAVPSWTGEGVVFLWNAAVPGYQIATPALWSALIAGPFVNLIPLPGPDAPLMDGVASAGVSPKYSREDHVHPTDTTRAPLASPFFTGTPEAPTPALGDNSQLLATTAFVIANGALPPPIGSVIAYAGSAAPALNWQICTGQAVSRATFAALFAVLGITFGSGDGVTTFNLPDLRGRVLAGVDGGANRLTTATMSSQALAGIGGTETHVNTLAETPTGITVTGTVTVNTPGVTVYPLATNSGTAGSSPYAVSGSLFAPNNGTSSFTFGNSMSGTNTLTSNNTSGSAHINVQPTMELNYLMRVA